MDRTISLCFSSPPAATNRLQRCQPRSEFDEDAIRYAVRPMAARQRHHASATGAGGGGQQADRAPDSKGQPWQDRDERQTRRGVFEDGRPTNHRIRTVLDRKSMIDGGDSFVMRNKGSLHEVGETSFDLAVSGF